ncbi:MAG: PQQ-binding-like beta-propeller repeat protein [Bauldia sp.]|nr:PQQ-binding-like beta-propeller repeat protein [Bauldia sp.]
MTASRKLSANSRVRSASLLAATILAAAAPAGAQEVSFQRLLNAENESQNWLLVYGNYASHMASSLSQINRDNVRDLEVKFMVSLLNYDLGGATGAVGVQQTPLVNDGYLYVNTGTARMFKIDVRSGNRGDVLWVNDPDADTGGWQTRIRGISLLGNNVYTPTSGAELSAVDANSGETVFFVSAKAPEPEAQNQGITAAPLAVKDMIILGHATGSGNGHRAWLAAFDAATGEERWRTFMVPGPGEPGHETWEDDHNAYLTGGAAIWSTPSYDPDTNLLMIGTGDPAPWSAPEFRPGDNLYSASTVALDADTGEIKWYFQEIPNESWDMDTVNPRMLYDLEVDGQMRKVMGTFSRNGFYYTLDRTNGEFVWARPYLDDITWTTGLDPKTGLPVEYDPNVALQDYAGRAQRYGLGDTRGLDICPVHSGQPTYWPPHFDAERMTAYVQHSIGCANYTRTQPVPDGAQNWVGVTVGNGFGWQPSRGPYLGAVSGFDVRTGEVVARFTQTDQMGSGNLGTGGDLLFMGHTDGRFAAYDKDSLTELWTFNVGTGFKAPPITYSIDGEQYIAVVAGQARGNLNIQSNQLLIVFGLR